MDTNLFTSMGIMIEVQKNQKSVVRKVKWFRLEYCLGEKQKQIGTKHENSQNKGWFGLV